MSIKKLQELSGIAPDGLFGEQTFKAGSAYLGITEHTHGVHFFAQVGHETGNFRTFTENLNYSAQALRKTFGKYFPDAETAEKYARRPEMIANRVYANRMGNGSPESGDGWRFRGRGALQLTGKDNYSAFARAVNDPEVLDNPAIVAEKYAFTSAKFFFDKNNLWRICEEGFSRQTIKKLTRRINGGLNGIDHRVALTRKFSTYSL